jgi:hypothetical protein
MITDRESCGVLNLGLLTCSNFWLLKIENFLIIFEHGLMRVED